jgi:hypothetical protein
VWAVGTLGTILHLDGKGWSAEWIGDERAIVGVWGAASNEVYVVSHDGATRRFDGETWSTLEAGFPPETEASKLLASSARTAWVSTYRRDGSERVLRFDGTRWQDAELGAVTAMWAAGPEDLFVVPVKANPCEVEHHVGGSVKTQCLPFFPTMLAGSGPDDVWASDAAPYLKDEPVWLVSWLSRVARYDGRAWRLVESVQGPVFVVAPGDVWAGADHLVAGAPQTRHEDAPSRIHWAAGAMDVWGIHSANHPDLVRWDGAAWWTTTRLGDSVRVLGETSGASGGVREAWGISEAPGAFEVVRFDGRDWSVTPGSALALADLAFPRIPVSLGSSYGSSPSDFWLVHGDRLFHWDGTAWSAIPAVEIAVPVWTRLSGTAHDDVWVVSGGSTFHWDGETWTRHEAPLPDTLQGLWAASQTDLFAITTVATSSGDGMCRLTDRIWRFDGARWVQVLEGASHGVGTRCSLSADEAGGMWGATPRDAWATGLGFYHYDGTAWTEVEASIRGSQLWGTGADDVWIESIAWGDRRAWHWDGERWTPFELVPFTGGVGHWAHAPASGSLWHRETPAAK